MSVYSRALNAFSFRFGRDDGASTGPVPAKIRPGSPAAKGARAAADTERGPGRYRKPTDGPTFRKLQELAETDPRAGAALEDVRAGKFSATQALVQIGQRNPRSTYRELLSVWGRASADERRDFLAHVRSEGSQGE